VFPLWRAKATLRRNEVSPLLKAAGEVAVNFGRPLTFMKANQPNAG
jgi:hypothetical protein